MSLSDTKDTFNEIVLGLSEKGTTVSLLGCDQTYYIMGSGKSRLNLPIPSGPFSVGTADVMTELSNEGCFFRLYYPADYQDITTRQVQFPYWLPRDEYLHGFADFLNLPFKKFRFAYKWKVGNVFIPALWHAPLAYSTGVQVQEVQRFPLLIFSHGLGGNRTAYSTICCDLASHGFIVAAVEHRDKSACFSYYYKNVDSSSGEYNMIEEIPVKYQQIEPGEKEFPIRSRQLHRRVTECIKILHLMEAIDLGKEVDKVVDQKFDLSMFKDRIDLSRVSIMGHSFGGATVIGALAATTDFRVGVVLDGWMFPLENSIYPNVTQPILFTNTELFQWKDNIKRMKRLDSDTIERTMVTLNGSVHQSQTDFTFMLKGWLATRLQARGPVDPYLCNEINNALCVTFLRKHLSLPCEPTFSDVMSHYKDWVRFGSNVNIDGTQSQL